MGKIKENWQVILFTAFMTMLFSGLLTIWVNRESKVSSAASTEYVDKKHGEQKIYIDEKFIPIEGRVHDLEERQLMKADKGDIAEIKKTLGEQNKMLFDILKEVKK